MDVTEATFASAVLDRSHTVPVVVDFWAEWCGPCRQLGPVLERAVAARDGKVELAKVDTDANPNLARDYGIQGIPAVKAFRDGAVASEFVGVQPPIAIDRFLDALVPSEADGLIAAGDEASLRRAVTLEPSRADAAVPLARILAARGEADAALALLREVPGSFAADGLAARIRLRGRSRLRAPHQRLQRAGRRRPGDGTERPDQRAAQRRRRQGRHPPRGGRRPGRARGRAPAGPRRTPAPGRGSLLDPRHSGEAQLLRRGRRLQAGHPHPEQPHRSRRSEASQQVARDRPDPRRLGHRL